MARAKVRRRARLAAGLACALLMPAAADLRALEAFLRSLDSPPAVTPALLRPPD